MRSTAHASGVLLRRSLGGVRFQGAPSRQLDQALGVSSHRLWVQLVADTFWGFRRLFEPKCALLVDQAGFGNRGGFRCASFLEDEHGYGSPGRGSLGQLLMVPVDVLEHVWYFNGLVYLF